MGSPCLIPPRHQLFASEVNDSRNMHVVDLLHTLLLLFPTNMSRHQFPPLYVFNIFKHNLHIYKKNEYNIISMSYLC